tara:strand:+ start:2914 stop:3252 length:339 start_codon:yes stop_codon:yes gene_type:complete
MFKKPLIISLSIFLILMIFTSTVKHRTRSLEKKINKTNKEIVILKKQLSDAETDFVYLSSPAQLKQYLIVLEKKDYSPYDYSRIFQSTDQFLTQISKETKLIKKVLYEKREK